MNNINLTTSDTLNQIFITFPKKLPFQLFLLNLQKTSDDIKNGKIINSNILWLSRHNCLTIDIILKYNNIPWNMDAVSYNVAIDPINSCNYPFLNWNYRYLSYHPKLTKEIFYNLPYANWDYEYLNNKFKNTEELMTEDLIIKIPIHNKVPTYEEFKKKLYDFDDIEFDIVL